MMRAILLSAALAAAAPAIAAPADFIGVWMPVGDGLAHPEGGGAPPLTAAAKRNADPDADPAMHCLPHGTPRLMLTPSPVQILVTAKRVAFVHQVNHTHRLVYLDRDHDPAVDPSYLGEAIGRWQGDELTIDTVNFRPGLLDRSGIPVGEKLHVIERYRLADRGRRLEGRITIEDPENFTRSWSFPVVLQRDDTGRIAEDICADKSKAERMKVR